MLLTLNNPSSFWIWTRHIFILLCRHMLIQFNERGNNIIISKIFNTKLYLRPFFFSRIIWHGEVQNPKVHVSFTLTPSTSETHLFLKAMTEVSASECDCLPDCELTEFQYSHSAAEILWGHASMREKIILCRIQNGIRSETERLTSNSGTFSEANNTRIHP